MIDVPNHWKELESFELPPGSQVARVWRHRLIPDFKVLRSLSTTVSGEQWFHVSVSRSDRLPTWQEIVKVKNEFMGEDREAYQVIPRVEDHINIHQFCIHLLSPLDQKPRVANLQEIQMESAV